MSEQEQSAWESCRGAFTRFIVGAAGALLYTTMSLVWPKPHPPSVLDPGPRNLLGIVGWLFRLSHLLGNYYVQLAIFIVFVCLAVLRRDRKSTRLNSSHSQISYAVFCLKKKKKTYSAID